MRYRLECPANRYVFKSRLNCSESTAGSLRQSGSEFQTVGPATEKARVQKVPRRTRGTNSWWRLAKFVVNVVPLPQSSKAHYIVKSMFASELLTVRRRRHHRRRTAAEKSWYDACRRVYSSCCCLPRGKCHADHWHLPRIYLQCGICRRLLLYAKCWSSGDVDVDVCSRWRWRRRWQPYSWQRPLTLWWWIPGLLQRTHTSGRIRSSESDQHQYTPVIQCQTECAFICIQERDQTETHNT